MKRRRGEPYSPGYPKGHVSISVSAVPFSQYLEPGEVMEVFEPDSFATDRRWNGREIFRPARGDD